MRSSVRRVLVFVTTVAAALAGVFVNAPTAFAATITAPTGNPFVVPGNAAGQPQAFTISATGFAADTAIFVEQCDGVATTTVGWDPTDHCDLGSSPASQQSSSAGAVTFSSTDVNHRFSPFKGISPQGIFNCLGPTDPSPANGLPNYTNCKLRVSSNNTAATSDQVFLNLQLPNSVAPPPGAVLDCGLRGSFALKPVLSDVPPKRPKADKVKGASTLGTAAGDSCVSGPSASGATKYPVTAGTIKVKGAFPAGSNCSALATPPLAGTELKIKWQGVNPKKGTLTTAGKTLAHVASTTAGPTGYTVVAPVVSGAFAGSDVVLTLHTDDSPATLTTRCRAGGLGGFAFGDPTTSGLSIG